jgi:ferric-dicitrate binding protein FerR (iron transport regulator)
MPYKNPEHKQPWEREHREQRNAQRKMRRLEAKNVLISRHPAPDPNSKESMKTVWIAGLAVALALVLLAVLSGANLSGTGVRTNS